MLKFDEQKQIDSVKGALALEALMLPAYRQKFI